MPANKSAILRYRIIDRCIKNKYDPFPSKDDLREACEVALYGEGANRISRSTIEKDLRAMREEEHLGYFAPIEYSKRENGYFYTDKNYSIEKLPISEEEIDALNLAINTLHQFREIKIFEGFDSVIEKLLNLYNAKKENNSESIIQFEKGVKIGGAAFISVFLKAIKSKQNIQFDYYSFWRKNIRTIKYAPLKLREYRNRWYVDGFSYKHNEIRTFALDRMSVLLPLEETHLHQLEQTKNTSIGIISGNKAPEKVVLKFDEFKAEYIFSLPLHSSQKLVEETDTHYIFEYWIEITPELFNEILSFGAEVEVLEPTSLREAIKKGLQKALKKY